MELADALSITVGEPVRAGERRSRDGWYDPDSVAFLEGPDHASDGITRINDTRRREISAALPAGLKPLTLLVRVRREGAATR